jgi:transposase
LALCRELGVRGIVDRLCPMRRHRRTQITQGDVLEFLLVHITQHPDREPLYQLATWAQEHCVQYLWDCPAHAFNDDRVGRALETLGDAAAEIHERFVRAVRKYYPMDLQWLHWDLSYVRFTDARRETALVRAGYGNGQVHQRQVKLGLHVSSPEGLPLHYEMLPGNVQQQPRAKLLLQELQTRLQCQKLGLVSDRGGIGYDIVEHYLEQGVSFVSPLQWTPAERELVAALPLSEFTLSSYRSRGKPDDAYYVYPTELEFRRQKRPAPLPVAALVVHSEGKQRSAAQQRDKHIARTLDKLDQVASHLNQGRFYHGDYVRRVLDKKISKSLAGIVGYELSGPEGALELRWFVDPEALAEAAKLDGRYILVHQLPADCAPEQALHIHKRQHLVEGRFRNLRSDLAVNPVWLHRDKRIAGLVLVYIIALTLLVLLGLCSKRAGLETEHYYYMTAMAMLRRFSHLEVFLVEARGRPPNLQVELTPDQTEIIQALNLPHPDRLLHCR